MKKLVVVSNIALALVAGASVAGADTGTVGEKNAGGVQNLFSGSDTMVSVIENAFSQMTTEGVIASGDIQYLGAGSSNGQRQIEGGYTTANQPTCTPNDTGAGNAGCQEISPMSRLMDQNICNDSEAVGNAESMGICGDSIVVFSDNASYQSTSTGACTNLTSTDNAAGTIPFLETAVLGSTKTVAGYTIGSATQNTTDDSGATVVKTIEPWQDVLRIVYTGYKGTDPWGGADTEGSHPGNKLDEAPDTEADPAAPANRSVRCADPVRAALITSWYDMFDSASCNTGRCASGLRQAYRRDDASGTTGVFLDFLDVKLTITARTQTYGVTNSTTPATETHPFCDGGDFEGIVSQQASAALAPYGDPIRKPCAAEDDLCGRDGQLGVVRAVLSVPTKYQVQGSNPAVGNAFGFPTKQCTRNVFRMSDFASTGARVCPDGNLPLAGKCYQPVYTGGGVDDYNCINARTSRPPGANTSFDGRVYNFYIHSTPGSSVPDTASLRFFEMAQWRQNSVEIPAAGNPTTDLVKVCQEVDATANIGCIVGKTTCTIGWSGQQSVLAPPYDDLNEPFALNEGSAAPNTWDYLGRKLYINSIGGFENTSADCLRRYNNDSNGIPATAAEIAYCNAQVDLVNWLNDPADNFGNAASVCRAGFYSPLAGGPTCESHTIGCTGATVANGNLSCVAQ